MSHDPVVSVVIPTYCHEQYVLDTLQSVFNQTFRDFEVIVVNDGSPDNTDKLLRPLVESGRIRYFEQENAGQAEARNQGIKVARGEFIALLDDDDLWPPDKLEWQVAALRTNTSAVLVYGAVQIIGDSILFPTEGAPEGDVRDRFVDQGWIRSPGQTLIRSSVLKDIGGFDTSVWGVDDWDLLLRLAGKGTFLFRSKLALQYRIHEGNASRAFFRMFRNGMRVAAKHFAADPERKRRAIGFVRFFTSHDGLRLVRELTEDGRWFETRRYWWQLAYIKPRLLLERWFLINLVSTLFPRVLVKRRRRLMRAASGKSASKSPVI